MSELKVTIPPGVLDAHIRAAVLDQLGGADELMKSLVTAVMDAKVKKDYYSEKDKSFLTDTFERAVKDKVEKVIREEVDKRAEEIATMTRKALSAPKAAKDVEKAILEGIASAKWGVSVSFEPKK